MTARVWWPLPNGNLPAIPSKSCAHRLMICAALSKEETFLRFGIFSRDMEATSRCLSALGAAILPQENGLLVRPVRSQAKCPLLDCGESGSTYRFLLPVACALHADAEFLLAGRLPQRPMDAMFSALRPHGVSVRGEGTNRVSALGQLTPGRFDLPGSVSSQYVSALFFALPLLHEDSEIVLSDDLESAGYVTMTLDALKQFGVSAQPLRHGWHVPGGQQYRSPGIVSAEGDWSNAALLLCAAAARGSVTLTGLARDSHQGDRAVMDLIQAMGARVTQREDSVTVAADSLSSVEIDLSSIPDLAPALAVAAAAANGETRFTHAARLRLKESDRISAIADVLQSLGGDVEELPDGFVIRGGRQLYGGTANAHGDHRIAMMAACLAPQCLHPVSILGAESVEKSYPNFFQDIVALGAQVERSV